jgi:hypothetical protein
MRKAVSIIDSDACTGYAMSQAELFRRENISKAIGRKLVVTGELDTFVMGDRYRFVVLESYRDYVRRQRAGGLPRDPATKAAAITAYEASRGHAGARLAATARAGWGIKHRSGRQPRGKAAAEPAMQGSLSPQQKIRGRRQSSESKPPATLKDNVTIT